MKSFKKVLLDVKSHCCQKVLVVGGGEVALDCAVSLKKNGAKEVYICASHPVFSGPALERLANSEAKEIIVTNTIPLDKDNLPDKITQLFPGKDFIFAFLLTLLAGLSTLIGGLIAFLPKKWYYIIRW